MGAVANPLPLNEGKRGTYSSNVWAQDGMQGGQTWHRRGTRGGGTISWSFGSSLRFSSAGVFALDRGGGRVHHSSGWTGAWQGHGSPRRKETEGDERIRRRIERAIHVFTKTCNSRCHKDGI